MRLGYYPPLPLSCTHKVHVKIFDLNSCLILQSEHEEDVSAGPAVRDRSHIEDTLRLPTAEPSAEFLGEEQRQHLIDKDQHAISLLDTCIHTHTHTHTASESRIKSKSRH